jgi:hypothetical protein
MCKWDVRSRLAVHQLAHAGLARCGGGRWSVVAKAEAVSSHIVQHQSAAAVAPLTDRQRPLTTSSTGQRPSPTAPPQATDQKAGVRILPGVPMTSQVRSGQVTYASLAAALPVSFALILAVLASSAAVSEPSGVAVHVAWIEIAAQVQRRSNAGVSHDLLEHLRRVLGVAPVSSGQAVTLAPSYADRPLGSYW